MCLNNRFIFNKVLGREILVPCGHCEACRQKKADKFASRIRSHRPDGLVPMFAHLTYLNECVPYIRKSELLEHPSFANVYRDYDRYYYASPDGKLHLKYKRLHEPLDQIDFIDNEGYCTLKSSDIFNAPTLQNTYSPRPTTLDMSDKIGVIYYKDVQNFFKKFKQYLKRNFNFSELYDYKVTFCSVSEYGGEKYRPHFHLLIWCQRQHWKIFVSAVLKSWTYAFRYITRRRIEPAIDAASYVASYVNKSVDFPTIFEKHPIKQKHSFSQGFGTSLRAFRLSQILENVRRGSLLYDREVVIDGSPSVSSFLYPKYVISRYFPKYKGFSRLSDGSICWLLNLDVIPSGDTREYYVQKISDRLIDCVRNFPAFVLFWEDLRKIAVSIVNKVILCGVTIAEYARLYTSTWRCYYSTLYRSTIENLSIQEQWQYYDNIEDYFSGKVSSLSLDSLLAKTPNSFTDYEIDPNKFVRNINEHQRLLMSYVRRSKQHEVVDVAFSSYNSKLV